MITITGNSSITLKGGNLTVGSNPKGSILFAGTPSSNLLISNDVDLRFRTGDFTVEWFQYQTDNNLFTRPWSQGSWPGAGIAVSLEGGLFYYWENGVLINQGAIGTYKNVWVHFAVCRSGSNIRVFKNGSQLGSDISTSFDYNNTSDSLEIGNQTDNLASAAFGGYITNFRWTKGEALYTSTFPIPTKPLTVGTNTKILLLASSNNNAYKDSSPSNKTINHTGTIWDAKTPF